MLKCAVVIPIYKSELTEFEISNTVISINNLKGHDIYLLCPENLDTNKIDNHLGIKLPTIRFEDFNFQSIQAYSKLILSKLFYDRFTNYSHILICQTDAIILKSELEYWLDQPYDYIGAPWPDGFELTIKTKHIPIPTGIKCKAFVGNGGLSLRRVKGCLELFEEYDDIHSEWIEMGHAEDLFYGFAGYLSMKFRLPNLYTAAHFSHETQPDLMFNLIGNKLPFGAHGFDKYLNTNVDSFKLKYLSQK